MAWTAMHKLYGVGFSFDRPNYTLSFSTMILTLEPPSKTTSSINFFPAIWWSMATKVVVGFGKASFDGIRLIM